MTEEPRHIAVIGGTGVGLMLHVPTLPVAGQTALATSLTYIDGGKAAGQAMGVARLDYPVELLSTVGDDALGERMRRLLDRESVGTRGLKVVEGEATMLAAVEVDETGENRIVVALNAMEMYSAADVEAAAEVIQGASLCLVSLEVPVGAALAALQIARDSGIPTILNPAPAPDASAADELLALSDIVTPNESEAASLCDLLEEDPPDPEQLAEQVAARGPSAVALTLGASGVLLWESGTVTRVPAPRVHPDEIVDTTGAGDGFNAAFAVALARGASLPSACGFGVEGGSRIIKGQGIVDALDQWDDFNVEP